MIALLLVLLLHLSCLQAENKAQDYYSILGIPSHADEKQIRNAYRKLAKVHHPDKHKGSDKAKHEAIFREVAQAYEVLSDPMKRQEYDRLLHSEQYASNPSPDQTSYQRSQDYYAYQQSYNFNDLFEDLFDQMNRMHHDMSYSYYQPELTGSYIPAGEVILPYSPVMTSEDRSHFALLDVSCSFIVYKGSVEDYLYSMMYNQAFSTKDISAQEIYRTPSASQLQGRCFAGLDLNGELKVFAGQPTQPDYYPIWSTTNEDTNNFPSYYKRYFVELSNSGEVSVRMLVAGSSDEVCIWSSRSCNRIVASVIHSFRNFLSSMKSLLGTVSPIIQFIREKLLEYDVIQRLNRLMEYLESKTNAFLDFLFPDPDVKASGKKRSEKQHRHKSYYQY